MSKETKCCKGPGYASPIDAFKNGPREKLIYVPCIMGEGKKDYLATVDCDPESKTFSQVIHRLQIGEGGDELHHTGWNACSSCHGDSSKQRRYLIAPALMTTFFKSQWNYKTWPVDPTGYPGQKVAPNHEPINTIILWLIYNFWFPVIYSLCFKKSGSDIAEKYDMSYPHTSHCLGSGEIMISMMGDKEGNGKGGFLLLDDKFDLKGTWAKKQETSFGYDFWYQPRHNIMVSSEWGEPNAFKKGFNPQEVADGKYGKTIHFWDWEKRELLHSVDLGNDGLIPLEIRFMHDPSKTHGYVGAALSSNVIHFWKNEKGEWKTEKVIDVAAKEVTGWALPNMPGLITDILISMDDKYLYFSNWLHGDIRQYDITDPHKPKLVGQIFVGGCLRKGGPVKITGEEGVEIPTVQGNVIRGGPQMIQLSLDGKRLYFTTSLFTPWDTQFYPEMTSKGSQMLQVDIDTEKGGMKLNEKWLVDFGKEPWGAALAHELRYPGGDCTSDIWL